MLAVEEGSFHCRDKELGSIGVGTRVSHRQDHWFTMLQDKIFVLEFFAIDTFTTSSVPPREITSLTHESRNHAMEFAAFIMQWYATVPHPLFAGTQCAKVFCGLRNDVPEESNLDASSRLATNFKIEENGVCDVSRANVLSALGNSGRR